MRYRVSRHVHKYLDNLLDKDKTKQELLEKADELLYLQNQKYKQYNKQPIKTIRLPLIKETINKTTDDIIHGTNQTTTTKPMFIEEGMYQ